MPVAMQLLEMLATKPVNRSARPGPPGRRHDSSANTTFRLSERRGWTYLLGSGGPYAGLLTVAALLWRSHPGALGWLAVVEGWLLVTGTVAAWVMLSNAGGDATAGDASDKSGE